jgi:nicotinamide-nucleotide amidase
MTANQERQAMLLEGATPLLNSVGTAPGVYLLEKGVHYAFLPGVPLEMHEMFRNELLPILKNLPLDKFQAIRMICCFGPPEGQIDTVLQEVMDDRREIVGAEVGLRIRFPNIDIRLRANRTQPQKAQEIVDLAAQLVLEKLSDCIFGGGEDTLQEAVSRLLIEKNQTMATAESCTGGLLANWITNVPGASQYFLGGVVSYSNSAKVEMLGVSEKTLQQFGAVSAETALEMARGVRKKTGADFGISVTGIAGPTGGSDQKPVGTVFIAVVHAKEEWVKEFHFPLGRLRFKQLAAATALDRVRKILLS